MRWFVLSKKEAPADGPGLVSAFTKLAPPAPDREGKRTAPRSLVGDETHEQP